MFRHRHNAFTLVELLVVITIMAMLLSLLLPAIQASNDIAKSTLCTGRMRQLGLAINVYTYDNHNRYPYGAWRPWVAPTMTWDILINEQMGATDAVTAASSYNYPLLICPSDPKKQVPGATYAVRSYMMTTAITGGESFYVASTGPGTPPASVSTDFVPDPAGTFLLVESPNNLTGRGYYITTTAFPCIQSGPLLMSTNPSYVSYSAGSGSYTVYTPHPPGSTTHPNAFNYLYTDGHCKPFYPLDTDTRPGILGAPQTGMRSNFWFQNSTVSANGGWTLLPND